MELKANELRIGNFINDEQTTHIVVGVDNYYIKSYWLKDKEKETLYETPMKLIKPIPLTEEWLLKFGFKHSGNGFFIHTESLLELANIGNDFFLAGIKGISLNTIYYTHQLQNLYFALTNKELEIKM